MVTGVREATAPTPALIFRRPPADQVPSRSERGPGAWLAILIVALIASNQTQVRLLLFDGLMSVRPDAVVLIGMILFLALSTHRYGWRPWNTATVLLGLVAAAVLLRSLWPVAFSDPEPLFVDRSAGVGAPSWMGATHSKGLVTSLLLVSYVALTIAVSAFVRQPRVGPGLANLAANVLVGSITAYALIFLALLIQSVATTGLNPTLWTVEIRGIDISRVSDVSLFGIGPDQGVVFATGAILAGSRAAFRTRRRRALVASALILLTATLLSFSRGAWLVAFVGFLILLLLKSRFSRMIAGPYIVAFALVLAGLSGFAQTVQGDAVARLFLGTDSGTIGARLQQWGVMLAALMQQPLGGFGAEGYRPFTSGFPGENFPLEIAFSGGLLVLVAWTAGQLIIVRRSLGQVSALRRRADDTVIPFMLALFGYTVGTMTNESGWDPIYWLLMGVVVGAVYRVPGDQPSPQGERLIVRRLGLDGVARLGPNNVKPR